MSPTDFERGGGANPGHAEALLELHEVSLVRDGRLLLDSVSWRIDAGEHWVVLGANGSGKSTLVAIASLWLHPTSGRVQVLGGELGRIDVRRHRERIGLTSPGLATRLRPDVTALEVVVTGLHAALETWWHTYDEADLARAEACLARFGVGELADRTFGSLSSGERQRVLLARTLVREPRLVLLDEPTAGLDLGGREQLVSSLAALAADPTAPTTVLVTHHLEDIPPGFTHLIVLRSGRALASGPIDEVLYGDLLSDAFGVPLRVERDPVNERWVGRAVSR